MKYLCLALLSLPISSVGSMLFQSIGKSGTALLLACIQSGFIFIPLISILPHFFHIYGIMLAQPCSYVIAAMITLPFVIKFLKTMKE